MIIHSFIHFTSAFVAVVFSQLIVSASWRLNKPPSSFVTGHKSTMCSMVCCSLQSQSGDEARPHLCMLVRHGPWPVWKQFNIVQGHGRLKPGCWIATKIYINRDQLVTTKPCHHTIVSVMYWHVVVTCYRNALSDTGKICSLEVSSTFSLSLMLLKFEYKYVQMLLLMCNNNQRCSAAQLCKLCRAAVL